MTILVSMERANEIVSCCSRNNVPNDCMGLCMTYRNQTQLFVSTRSNSRHMVDNRSIAHLHCWHYIETITRCKTP